MMRTSLILVAAAALALPASAVASPTIYISSHDYNYAEGLLTTDRAADVIITAAITYHTNGNQQNGSSRGDILVGGARCGDIGSSSINSGTYTYYVTCSYRITPKHPVKVRAEELGNNHATASGVTLAVSTAEPNDNGEIGR